MASFNCPGCNKAISTDVPECPECGRKIKRTEGKPVTLQFIVEVDKINLFYTFLHSLSDFIGTNYDLYNFSYNITNICDETGRNTNYLKVKTYIENDSSISKFIDDWIDNKLGELNLYKNNDIYNEKFKTCMERKVCPSCQGKGIIKKEGPHKKCQCKDGYVYSKAVCPECGGSGRFILGLLKCRRCLGSGYFVYKYKCSLCQGAGYTKTFVEEPCVMCSGEGYLKE